MGLLDSAVEALTTTKAIIEVIDSSKNKTAARDVVGCVGRLNDYSSRKMQYTSARAQLEVAKTTSKVKEMAMAVTGIGLGDSEELKLFNKKVTAFDSAVEVRRFEVQFNPSSLSLSGNGGGFSQFTNYSAQGSDRGVSYEKASEHIEMSVQLIFDETNNLVTFPGDITSINVSNVAGTAANVITDKIKGRPSVQTEVEGFLGAIRNEYTRSVAFCWGKLLYFGYVNRVSTKYTLFNPSGKPVRATVDMTIVCADATVTPGNLGHWAQKYEDFFKTDMSLGGANNGLVNLSNFSR